MRQIVVRRAELQLFSESFGPDAAPAILLLAGNGCSATYWPAEFLEPLVAAGFRVIRFDYRDTGASTHRPYKNLPYTLEDLVADALAIADAHGAPQFHAVGLSLGGFLAQRLALDHGARLLSLTALMSTSDYSTLLHTFSGGEAPTSGLPAPSQTWMAALGQLPPTLSPEDAVVESWVLATASPADRAYWRSLVQAAAARGNDAAAGEAHRDASLASGRNNLLGELAHCQVPTLFIGGSLDPIFPPGHAEASAKATPNGRWLQLDGLGHGLSPAFIARIAAEVVAHATSVASRH